MMHPFLASHLHQECAEVIEMLHSCHKEFPIKKFFGQCNDIKIQLSKCLEKEDMKRRRQNNEAAKKRHQKFLDACKEKGLR